MDWMRRAGRAAAVALFAGSSCLALFATGLGAQEGAPEPNQVIGYAQPEFLGASEEWRLPPEKPFLIVESPTGDLAAIASIKLGAEVGVTLFEERGLASRDSGCQPALGSEARPDLAWRGPTAHFEPAAAGDGEPLEQSHLPKRFASLLIYRRDQGPPPGVLLMDRLVSPSFGCSNPLHTTRYQRLFVPPPEAPARGRCVDLADKRMPRSDRAVLLLPGDFDDSYKTIDHRFSIALFDGANCEGNWAIIPSYGQPKRDFDLREVDFRDRARSLLVVYDGGIFDPLLEEPKAPLEPQTPVATSDLPPEQSGALPPAASAEPAPGPAPEPAGQSPIAAAAESARAAAAQPAPQPAETAAAPAAPAAAAAQPEPPAQPDPQVALAAGPRAFPYPVHEVYRVNYCLNWERDCGAPAADAFCKAQGYTRAQDFKLDENIGNLFPTIVMGENRICSSFVCDGFQEITCTR